MCRPHLDRYVDRKRISKFTCYIPQCRFCWIQILGGQQKSPLFCQRCADCNKQHDVAGQIHLQKKLHRETREIRFYLGRLKLVWKHVMLELLVKDTQRFLTLVCPTVLHERVPGEQLKVDAIWFGSICSKCIGWEISQRSPRHVVHQLLASCRKGWRSETHHWRDFR